jgi:toxin ParE1/3/4
LSNAYALVASPLFKLSQQRLAAFLTKRYSSTLAGNTLANIRQRLKQDLAVQPRLAPISERLLALGITEYRQWQVDEHNIVFYRVDEQKQRIELLLLMDSRQNAPKLLFELMLLV